MLISKNSEKTPYDIAIVGAGVAGMTAAIYALRAKKSVLIFEETVPGGQIINTSKIENYPGIPEISGPDFAKTLKSQVASFGGKFYFSTVEKIKKIKTPSEFPALFSLKTSEDEEFFAKTIIISSGSRERKLDLPGEDRLSGRGISYCATCDGSFFKNKTVAVYGGGNTALYSALYLSNLAKTVYLIIRRNVFRAEPSLVRRAEEKENIKFIKNRVISALAGEKSLSSVVLSASNGSSAPEETLPLDGLFISIGRIPDNQRFKDFISLDDEGYISSDESCKTSVPGVFCAGDARKKPLHQLVTATSDGATAATAAIDFLNSF